MKSSRSVQTYHYDRSTRIHIVILYIFIACLVILWGLFFVYYARTIRNYINDLNHMKQRLHDLEETQVTITSAADGYDPINRRLRHARLRSKILDKQHHENQDLDSLSASTHFKVPVRRKKRFK